MDTDQSVRYARHIRLEEIGVAGQRKLANSKVLVIGAGGLGSPVIMYLAAAGIGELSICDFDHIELSNLQRQILHTTADVGRDKVDSAADAIARLNPDVAVRTIGWAIDGDDLLDEVRRADAVVDASDNFETRFALNQACVSTGTPLVSGAAIRWEGHITVIDPRVPGSPCYRCLYEEDGDPDEPCALVGVFAPLLGVIGSLQGAETLKLLLGTGEPLIGRLLMFDAAAGATRTVRYRRDPACPVCQIAGPATDKPSA